MTPEEIKEEFRDIISHALLGSECDISKETWEMLLDECTSFSIKLSKQRFGQITVRQHKDKVLPLKIISDVAAYYEVPIENVISKSRKASFVRARHMSQYLIRCKTDLSYPEIGELFGAAHHTSVLHGEQSIRKQISLGNSYKKEAEFLETIIKNGA